MDFVDQIERGIRARYFVMAVETTEEGRAISLIQKACEKMNPAQPVICWDVADGFRWISEKPENADFALDQKDPDLALRSIEAKEEKYVFILKDFHEFWDQPKTKRKLRNMSQTMKPTGKTIIILNPSKKLPDELKEDIGIVELALPREQELNDILANLEERHGQSYKVELTEPQRKRFLQAALGLTSVQAMRVFRRAAVQTGKVEEKHIKLITEEKRAMIRQSEALEFFPVSETVDDIGGLDCLKEWLQLRREAFGEKAQKFGLPAPKGIALIGIPGTGKSLTAKAIGSIWRLPVLRLDVGALFGGLVGESEERTRKALSVASTISPCILWIDEIEKAFGQGDLDGGTSSRVFGSILTWMQEKTAPVFVVATANNVAGLRPELLRKGRFDEIFFLDLPSSDERQEIFHVLLNKYKRPPNSFDLESLAKESNQFVGAEIEEAIRAALYKAFSEEAQLLKTEHIVSSLRSMIPLAVSQKEEIARLRKWLSEGRAISASYKEKKDAIKKAIEVEDLIDIIER